MAKDGKLAGGFGRLLATGYRPLWTALLGTFFFQLVTRLNMVPVIQGKIIEKWSEEKQKFMPE